MTLRSRTQRKKATARRYAHAALLKSTRESQGKTLAELAVAIGWSVSAVSNVENGHDLPSKRMVAALSRELGLDLPARAAA